MTRRNAVGWYLGLLILAWATPHGHVSAQSRTDKELSDPSKWTVMTGIDLSDEQKTAITKVVSQYAQYEDWLSGKLKTKTVYPDSISKAKASVAQEQISENRINQINAVREILTDKQRATFDNNVLELIARYQRRQAVEAMQTAKSQ